MGPSRNNGKRNTKTNDFGPTEIHYADATVRLGRVVIGQVMTNADRSVFRLIVGGRVHTGWRGSWDGFMECAQNGSPMAIRYRFTGV